MNYFYELWLKVWKHQSNKYITVHAYLFIYLRRLDAYVNK
jgi:hypothetical protein